MRTYYNGIQVETSGVRSISGGGTNASTASQALSNLGAYPSTNPSGFITGVDLSSYTRNSQTGSFVTADQTGAFYPVTNPSGYATNVSVASLSGTVTGNYIQGNGAITNIVSLTQAQFNLISVPSPSTVYLIIG